MRGIAQTGARVMLAVERGSVLLTSLSLPVYAGQFPDGAETFKRQCALCHRADSGRRAPAPAVLGELPQDNILQALEDGPMRDQGGSAQRGRTLGRRSILGKAGRPGGKA
jgi:hypothetical protein